MLEPSFLLCPGLFFQKMRAADAKDDFLQVTRTALRLAISRTPAPDPAPPDKFFLEIVGY